MSQKAEVLLVISKRIRSKPWIDSSNPCHPWQQYFDPYLHQFIDSAGTNWIMGYQLNPACQVSELANCFEDPPFQIAQPQCDFLHVEWLYQPLYTLVEKISMLNTQARWEIGLFSDELSRRYLQHVIISIELILGIACSTNLQSKRGQKNWLIQQMNWPQSYLLSQSHYWRMWKLSTFWLPNH